MCMLKSPMIISAAASCHWISVWLITLWRSVGLVYGGMYTADMVNPCTFNVIICISSPSYVPAISACPRTYAWSPHLVSLMTYRRSFGWSIRSPAPASAVNRMSGFVIAISGIW